MRSILRAPFSLILKGVLWLLSLTAKTCFLYTLVFSLHFLTTASVDSYKTVRTFASVANNENKSYVVCVLATLTLELSPQDISNCKSFKELSDLSAGTVASVEPLDGECPAGYQAKSHFSRAYCIPKK